MSASAQRRAACAEEGGPGAAPRPLGIWALPTLPMKVIVAVLMRLPLDDRLRLSEVCHAWRDMLSERSLWMHLDASTGGLSPGQTASDGLLRAAAARALRNVRSLDVSGSLQCQGHAGASMQTLCRLVAENPRLQVIRVLSRTADGYGSGELRVDALRTLLRDAPRLTELHADVVAPADEALELFQQLASAQPAPFGPLRLHYLLVRPSAEDRAAAAAQHFVLQGGLSFFGAANHAPQPVAPVLGAMLAALPRAQDLQGLWLPSMGTSTLSASVDAAVAQRLRSFTWSGGGAAGGAAVLTRLLQDNYALKRLRVLDVPHFHAPGSAVALESLPPLCAALTASRLKTLALCRAAIRRFAAPAPDFATAYAADSAAAVPVLCALAAALAGHPTLTSLSLCVPLRAPRALAHALADDAQPGVAAAVAALATPPQLTTLDLSGCNFSCDELQPLLAALAAGAAPRGLRALQLLGAHLLPAFVREVLLPSAVAAIAAGSALQELHLLEAVPPFFPRTHGAGAPQVPAAGGQHPDTVGALRGAERAVRAAAAARGSRFVFRAEHAPLCRREVGDADDAVPAQAPLARALARASELTRVVLGGAFTRALATDALCGGDAAALLSALAGHLTLEALTLEGDLSTFADALAPALGAVVAADAPALTSLRLAGCALGDAGLRPLVAALPGNTHLRTLECDSNALSAAFAREVLLPAVRANAGLTRLSALSASRGGVEGALAAMAHVQERTNLGGRSS